jgi:hypothetical protein
MVSLTLLSVFLGVLLLIPSIHLTPTPRLNAHYSLPPANIDLSVLHLPPDFDYSPYNHTPSGMVMIPNDAIKSISTREINPGALNS